MPLRKALIAHAGAPAANSGSFVNETSKRLHVRKTVGTIIGNAADTIGEVVVASLDEVPVTQHNIDDSRSHIDHTSYAVIGGTAAVIGTSGRAVLSFNRNDLVLDSDEALFSNSTAAIGAAQPQIAWNLWYED